MEIYFLSLSLSLLTSTLISCTTSFSNFTTDEYALIAFKNAIQSDPKGNLVNNWSSNTSICYWTGVSCNTRHGRITTLNISWFGLQGTIVPHLGNLTFLRSLDVSYNNFTGFIPSELSKLRHLRAINAGFNKLSGEIPSWFGALSRLQYIYLGNNTFTGRIAPFFNISTLRTLDLANNFLYGNIPEEIGNLSSLETLNLQGNELSGSIPNGLFNMSSLVVMNLRMNLQISGNIPNEICSNANPKLKIINLSRNKLVGQIPSNICKCRELEELYLSFNSLSGKIPSEIWSMTTLKILSLSRNQFIDFAYRRTIAGSIAKDVGNLTSLRHLGLSSNNLTGELPKEIGNLRSLDEFLGSRNLLRGTIPDSIFNMSSLKVLQLGFNEFSGSFPSTKGRSLVNLEILLLTANNLSGQIPSSITNASKLLNLELQINSFGGSIPDFGNLRLLQELRIWDNNLIGAESANQELGFLSSLTNCRFLEKLQVGDNLLNGVLPASIGNFSTSFVQFWASAGGIRGSIPLEIGNLSSLVTLYMYGNEMTGSIPTTFGKLKQLQRLNLRGNRLEGRIPNELCEMNNLGVFDMSQNMLTHEIPTCFGVLKSLKNINLGFNKLNSSIPSSLWNLTDVWTLNLSSNYLSGRLSAEIGNLKTINLLDLSKNQLSGDIPSLMDTCQEIEVLNLSSNKFSGFIPESLGNIKGLSVLNLTYNDLCGLIPKSLEDLHSLQYLNLSYNKLKGEIPNGGSFVNFTARSFEHNSALCGATRFQVPSCAENDRGPGETVKLMKYIVPSFVAATILVIIIVMFIKRRKQGKTESPASDTLIGSAWRGVSYVELVRGTGSFDEASLLGRGSFSSVYKGILSDGLIIAAKVFNLQLEKAIKSFDTESKILSAIRHRNLVRIIGCCTNTEFRALILEYMPNGSLEKWLYSDSYCPDLVQTLEIAIHVALALEYLHHGNEFPIVHCDMKPSNVLLDQDMVARVADFGIAKLFDEGEDMILTKTLPTIGYAAPEYGSEGKVSTKGDVYSYGIMLLEMFTRKKPTADIFNGEMSLKEWVNGALLQSAISEIVAPGLLSRDDQHFSAKEQCVSSIFNVAMKCLAFLPEERINMIQVVATLHNIKAKVTTAVVINRRSRP